MVEPDNSHQQTRSTRLPDEAIASPSLPNTVAMSSAILDVHSEKAAAPKAVAHLLPCRIQHDGPVDSAPSFWNPTTSTDGKSKAFFRGRELHGKSVRLASGYRGIVVEKQNKTIEAPRPDAPPQEEEDDEDKIERGALRVTAEFEGMVVWGAESMADAATDPYVRGMEEWLQVAESIHQYDEPARDQPATA
ncbi:hypothetical protein BN1723_011871 [Verticillium longisporum]|uniref:Uncharacterized protein n=1 Tax=Verticillium longisporum TaxID=100787 RepID=A0A0G4LBX8_VERLO|nr:hypothetical protein BN1723_011871 [Verticillium longisporum]